MSNIVSKKKTDDLNSGGDHRHHLAELCDDGIFLRRNGRIVCINRAGLDLIGGVEIGPLVGRSLLEFLPHEAHAGSVEIEQFKFGSEKQVYCAKGQLKRCDGSAIEVEVISPPCENKGVSDRW
jgi:PAS domain S-box-containing protein